jgi:FkbM family methyltransferase
MGIYGQIKDVMQRFGCDIGHYKPLRSDPFAVQQHLLAGRSCRTIFDVGAYKGHVAATYHQLFPTADIYSFEPFPPSYELLAQRFGKHSKIHLVNCAVSSQSGESTFNVNQNPATNSLLATGQGYSAVKAVTDKQIQVPTVTLDEFVASRNLAAPEILKFDIQGNELNALRGAEQMLSGEGPLLIYTEVLFEQLYQNCARFGDLAEFLAGKSYDLYNLYSLHHSPEGRLEYGDAVFVSRRLLAR